ncbi:MAG: COP23 domain-containing protein [Cyanobacteria bacterium P01_D01_bin.71]
MTYQWQRRVSTGLAMGVLLMSTSAPVWAQVNTDSDEVPAEGREIPAPSETEAPDETADTEADDGIALPAEEDVRFSCQMQNGQPTVMYTPVSQPGTLYAWATPATMGNAWPAERRCNEISRRLESYRPDGLLELQTGRENGYNTVCVTTEAVSSCRIVFTVPTGQDPMLTRDQVFDNLVLADQGQTTQGVNTLVEGNNDLLDQLGNVLGLPNSSAPTSLRSSSINLQPFLDAADGGTGTQLNQNSGRQLNPDNF